MALITKKISHNPFTIRTYAKMRLQVLCNPQLQIIGLKVPWNDTLTENTGGRGGMLVANAGLKPHFSLPGRTRGSGQGKVSFLTTFSPARTLGQAKHSVVVAVAPEYSLKGLRDRQRRLLSPCHPCSTRMLRRGVRHGGTAMSQWQSEARSGRLLLRHAVQRAQPEHQVHTPDTHHFAVGKQPRQGVQRDAIVSIVERGHKHQFVRDVEVGVACG